MKIELLDDGYVELIETWGSDERIIESARMSTQKGFEGWGPKHPPTCCPTVDYHDCSCTDADMIPGDEKLLAYLWNNNHATPFEMAGAIIEVKAPIFVFREWHRHRTQSYNEMSARYSPLPDENYMPTVERIMLGNVKTENRQAQGGGKEVTQAEALSFQQALIDQYCAAEEQYQIALRAGIPKELARLVLPVARYSKMRASANLRNWLQFLTLRMATNSQWEIRQYANTVHDILKEKFPRTLALFDMKRTR